MKTRNLLLLVGAFLALTVAAFAQEPAALPDLSGRMIHGIPADAILSLAGTAIVALVKILAPKLPSKWLPFIAPAATVLLDYLSSLTLGTESNVYLALGAGVASIGLYELKKRVTTA